MFSGFVCWWLGAPFTFWIWFAYAVYFIYVDYVYCLAVRLSKSIAFASISSLTIILVCSTAPIDTILIATTELFRYIQSVIMGPIVWEPCGPYGVCYGGSDGCYVLHLATFSECGEPVASTLVCSTIWVLLLVLGTHLIDIRL
jgi:hypothetical protein